MNEDADITNSLCNSLAASVKAWLPLTSLGPSKDVERIAACVADFARQQIEEALAGEAVRAC